MNEANGNQGLDGAGERAAGRGEHIDGETNAKRTAASEAIGDRAIEGLADPGGDEVDGEGELDASRAGCEVARDGLEAGQVHVDGQRSKGGERAQDERELPGPGA